MTSIKTLAAVTVSATCLALAGQATAANAFANGGFEANDGSTATGWVPAASGYSISNDAHSGSFSAELASPAFNAAVMLQNNVEDGGQAPLVVGDTPTLSFWSKGSAGGTGNVLFSLRFLDDVGNILYNSGNIFFHTEINPNTWTEITFDPGTPVPVGATAAFIEFSQGIGPIDGGNPAGSVLIDDLSLNVVPEPGSFALLGLGGLALIRRRRRA